MQTINLPSEAQLQGALAAMPSCECPAPNKEAIANKFNGSSTISEAVRFCVEDQLCSGQYLAALIISSCNDAGNNYEVQKGEGLERFRLESSEPIHVVVGNLTIHGDFVVESPLLVTGNLTVNGVYEDIGSESPVAILGNLRAQHMRTTGWVIVGGDTVAENYFYGHYNDDAYECFGTLSAKAILSDEHQILCGKVISVHTPVEGSMDDSNVFDLRQEEDVKYLEKIWDDVMAKVISLKELKSSFEDYEDSKDEDE